VFRLDLFHALTLGGKELELFEEETGACCDFCLFELFFFVYDERFLSSCYYSGFLTRDVTNSKSDRI